MKQAILGAGLFVAPIAWFTSLEVNFALAPLACAGQGKNILVFVSTATFGLAVASGVWAWTQRDVHRRLALAGAAVSAFSAIVILAQAIPNWLLGGCE